MDTDFHVRLKDVLRSTYPNSDDNLDVDDLIHANGNAIGALLYAGLFIPDTVTILDSVLISWNISASENKRRFLSLASEPGCDLEKLERSFNYVEIGYLFDATGRNSTDYQDQMLAEALALSWRAVLRDRYPDREFAVELLQANATRDVVSLCFHEKRG